MKNFVKIFLNTLRESFYLFTLRSLFEDDAHKIVSSKGEEILATYTNNELDDLVKTSKNK